MFTKGESNVNYKHGNNKFGKRTKEYRVWCHIRGRCSNQNEKFFHLYGGRGIKVCDRWRDFSNFLADMGKAPSPQHTIERCDNDGNYEPGNCRWATPKEQNRNTRRTIKVDGKCLKDTCAERGLSYEAVQARIRRGDPIERALSPLTGHAYRAMISAAPGGEGP